MNILKEIVSINELALIFISFVFLVFVLFRVDKYLPSKLNFEALVKLSALAYFLVILLSYGPLYLLILLGVFLSLAIIFYLFAVERKYIYGVSGFFLVCVPVLLLLGSKDAATYLATVGIFTIAIGVFKELVHERLFD